MSFFSRTAASATRALRAAPKADHCHVEIDGERVRVALNWSPRATRYTLRVRGAVREAVLTIPARGSLVVATEFLERHRGWLRARLSALPAATALRDGALIPLRGEMVRIAHAEGRGLVRLDRRDAEPVLVVPGAAEHLARRTTDYLKREARRDLEAATMRHAKALGVEVTTIRLGDPVSRWGSCSSSGTISYSWRIVMAPPEVLDYLVAHEVAHMREMNHSPRFWRVVEKLCPGMEPAKRWLARNGASLHAIGAA